MRGVIAWFIKNHVAANLLLFLVLVGGLLSLFTMKIEIFPEVSPDQIQISVEYRGASPHEIEESVIRPIEERIASLSGIDRIISVAREGQGSILVEALEGWDVHELFNDIKTEVDGLTTLPREAERPIVKRVVLRREVLNLALYGEADREVLKYWAEHIRDRLLELPGITEVDYFGLLPREIHIEIPEKNLRKYGLSLDNVAALISRESLDVAAGRLKNSREEFLVRVRGRRYFADEYRVLGLFGGDRGGVVRLSDLGEVQEELRDSRDYAIYYRGKPAAVIEIFRVGDQNVLHLARTVKENLPRIRAELPKGLHLVIMRDRTEILLSRIKLLVKNMLYGMILVTVLLSLFLHLNLAFWVILGIPLSFAFALWAMPHLGLSLNMISLFAFILVLGIVVDDAIVVGESVFHRRERGAGRLAAAVEGTFEVAVPVIFSVLTTMAAFWPLLYGVGAMGRFIRVIPAVVILVLAGSLLEALFILPAHLHGARIPRKSPLLSRPLNAFVYGPFRAFLLRTLNWRWFTAAALTALLFAVFSLWLGGRLRFTFFPRVEGNRMVATLRMPPDTPVERTLEVVRRVEAAGLKAVHEAEKHYGIPLLQYSVVSAGSTIVGPHGGAPELGSHIAAVEIRLVPLEKRPGVSTKELVAAWRKKVGDVSEAESLTFSGELFSMGKAISVALSHRDESLLRAAVEDLKAHLHKLRGLYDVEESLEEGKEELRFRLRPEARALGITLLEVARTIRAAFYGAEVLRFQREEDEISVLVRLPQEERSTLETLKHLRVRNAQGVEVPLLEVAEPYFAQGYVKLERLDRRRVIYVRAEVDEKEITGSEARRLLKKKILPELAARYPGLIWSFEGEGREEARTTGALKKEFILALMVIYILLAIPLRSFAQPVLIMLAIPFGIVGAFVGHLLLGYQLSILSFFGIVGLAGVVVNDALILVDLANRLRAEGKPLRVALEEATLRRFRPVILTTLTTFFGLLPMIFERSLQARFLIPMAVSLAFGVLFATVITLVLIPCGYLILEDLRAIIRKS